MPAARTISPMRKAHSPQLASEDDPAKTFETYVGSLYEALGYQVVSDTLLEGQQIDIKATRFLQGTGMLTFIIECKYRSKSPVSNAEVYDFLSALHTIAQRRPIARGILVTNSTFSRSAKAAARDAIELLTLRDLEKRLLGISPAFASYISAYEDTAIFREYVPLDAYTSVPGAAKQISNVERALLDLCAPQSASTLICILADYGAGKTTLLQRLTYTLAKRYLNNCGEYKPLFFPLKMFHRFNDLDRYLEHCLKAIFGCEIPLSLFWKELRRHEYIVLLDGFDEMSPQVSSETRLQNFLALSPLLAAGCPTILTCRPSYFVTESEYKTALDAVHAKSGVLGFTFARSRFKESREKKQKIEQLYGALHTKYTEGEDTSYELGPKSIVTIVLKGFSERQIDTYLARFDQPLVSACGRGWKDVKAFLLSLYDLRDLMEKPILLSMIKDTVVGVGEPFFDRDTVFTPSALYETYTNLSLDVDWAKGDSRRFLSKTERREFSQAIAIAMYDAGRLDVGYQEILLTIRRHRKLLKDAAAAVRGADEEAVATDLQVCTFLTRDATDRFRFVHRSFMEFFCASFLRREFLSTKRKRFMQTKIPNDILFFLGAMCAVDAEFRSEIVNQMRTRTREVLSRNVVGVYLNSASQFNNVEIEQVELEEVRIKRKVVCGGRFRRIVFRNCLWEEVRFEMTEFMDTVIVGSRLERVEFDRAQGSCQILESRLENCVLSDLGLVLWSSKLAMHSGEVSGGEIFVRGSAHFEQVQFNGGRIRFGPGISGAAQVARFEGCRLSSMLLGAFFARGAGCDIVLNTTSLDNCIIVGMRVELTKVAHGLRFSGCSGALVVPEPKESDFADKQVAVRRVSRALHKKKCYRIDRNLIAVTSEVVKDERRFQDVLRLHLDPSVANVIMDCWLHDERTFRPA